MKNFSQEESSGRYGGYGGHCCSVNNLNSNVKRCNDRCGIFFRVCLKHFQKEITPDCTFGEAYTPLSIAPKYLTNNSSNLLLQSSSSQPTDQWKTNDVYNNSPGFVNPIQFRFNFSWTVSKSSNAKLTTLTTGYFYLQGTFSLIIEVYSLTLGKSILPLPITFTMLDIESETYLMITGGNRLPSTSGIGS